MTQIFPSGDCLPENLLRFYVCFSNPMERGRAASEISLLGPHGTPETDALYRAPVELWDKAMRVLTILLDPGRLKRNVGPNRALGPPFRVGHDYSLVVGAGMTDRFNRPLGEQVTKRFRVTDAIRESISVDRWQIAPPENGSRQPVILAFPHALDWAMLSHTITIRTHAGSVVEGRSVIDRNEKRWRFTPSVAWAQGSYCVCIDSVLEDPCGNNLVAAFDRPLRPGCDPSYEIATHSIPFDVAPPG